MKSLMFMIFIALCMDLLQPSTSQKFDFQEPIIFDKGNSKVHPANWTLNGDILLTSADLILFNPIVSFQTCHDVCVVDLTKCPPDKVSNHQDSCYCKEKSGDIYRIHVGSTVKISQSDATLKATVPSRAMFGAISGTSVVGTFPKIIEPKAGVQARYRVDEGVSQVLLPSQTISVCQNEFVPIQVCVAEKSPETILTIGLQGDRVTSSVNTCVVFVNKYDFDKVLVHKLTFSIVESSYKTNTDISTIYVQENNECHPSTVAPQTTPSAAQTTVVDPLHKVFDAVSALTESVHSMKQDFEKALVTINSKVSQFESLESDHKQLKDMLDKAAVAINSISTFQTTHEIDQKQLKQALDTTAVKINTSSTQLSSLQSDNKELFNLVQSLNSSFAGSLQQNMDCGINYCSNDNYCDVKPKISRNFRCFRVEKVTKLSWHEAVKKCQDIGGFLTEIHDKQTLEYVKELVLRSFPNTGNVWLGASDEAHEGDWKWATSGKNMSITDWTSNQPNNWQGAEHCLHIDIHWGNTWNDAPCNSKINYICQKNSFDQDCNDWL